MTGSVGLDDALTKIFSNCKMIRSFSMKFCPSLTDRSLSAMLEMCPELDTVVIDSCANVTSRTIDKMHAHQIKALSIASCPRITSLSLLNFFAQPSRSVLRLVNVSSNSSINKAILSEIANLDSITHVNISTCPGINGVGVNNDIRRLASKLLFMDISNNAQLGDDIILYVNQALLQNRARF